MKNVSKIYPVINNRMELRMIKRLQYILRLRMFNSYKGKTSNT